MKKVLLVTHDYLPLKGGIARYLSSYYSHYDQSQLVLLLDQSLKVKGKNDRANFAGQNLPSLPEKTYYTKFFHKWINPSWLPLFFKVLKIAKKEQVDEIHCSHVLPIGTICWLIFKWKKIPYKIYFHGQDILLAKKKFLMKHVLKKILRDARILVANSEFTKKQIQSVLESPRDIEIFYPRIENHEEVRQAAIESQISQFALGNKFVFLTVARLVKRKGVDLVLDAMKKIVIKHPNTVYVILGTGPDEKELWSKTQENSLQNNVRFVGEVDDAGLNIWYEVADCFIMTTHCSEKDAEGFGMVYIEAGSHGVPSIASNCGGVSEAVLHNQTGIVVPPENVDSIARAMDLMIKDNRLLKRLGAQAKQRFYDKFSWRNFRI